MSFLDRFRPYPELKTGIVNLKSGTAFRGVVWNERHGWVVLRNVEILQDRTKAERRAMDGEVVVKREDIDFIQVVT